jgi:putative membrane protein
MTCHERRGSHSVLVALGAVALLTAGGTAWAVNPKDPTPTPNPNPGAPPPTGAADTATVLGKLHHSNQMEIEMGKLAQKNGTSKDVKAFGKTLVTDHTASDKKVTALAKQQKVDLAAAAPAMKPDEKMDKLKTQKGAEFDKAFAEAMLEDHQKDVSEASSARDSTSDPKLKTLLTETVPVLEKHRDTAQKLVTQLGGHASAP